MEVINPIYFIRPKIAVTGHRPNKLWGYDLNNPNYIRLKELFKFYLVENMHLRELLVWLWE